MGLRIVMIFLTGVGIKEILSNQEVIGLLKSNAKTVWLPSTDVALYIKKAIFLKLLTSLMENSPLLNYLLLLIIYLKHEKKACKFEFFLTFLTPKLRSIT